MIFLALMVTCCSVSAAFAEGGDSPDQNQDAGSDTGNASISYSYTADAKGDPIFTQTLSWDADPNALKYEITIKDSGGNVISHVFTETNVFNIKLSPGDYSYDIITWNLLGQPEIDTGWQDITVYKAEIPSLSNVSPTFLFLDSMNGTVTLKGHLLATGAKIYLEGKSGKKLAGKEISRNGDTEIVVAFPDKKLVTGNFDIVVVNPGGLSARESKAIHIMFEHPVDILFSVGYSPTLFFQDDWFKENWPDPVYWLGANAGLSVYFYKKTWGFLGVELTPSLHRFTGGDDQATLTSDFLLVGSNFLYKYQFIKSLYGVARAGGGIAFSRHSFDYKGAGRANQHKLESISRRGSVPSVLFHA